MNPLVVASYLVRHRTHHCVQGQGYAPALASPKGTKRYRHARNIGRRALDVSLEGGAGLEGWGGQICMVWSLRFPRISSEGRMRMCMHPAAVF